MTSVIDADGLSALNTPEQLAAYLTTTPGSLANARSAGVGVPFVKVGRLVRYRREDVLAYLNARAVTPGAEAA